MVESVATSAICFSLRLGFGNIDISSENAEDNGKWFARQ